MFLKLLSRKFGIAGGTIAALLALVERVRPDIQVVCIVGATLVAIAYMACNALQHTATSREETTQRLADGSSWYETAKETVEDIEPGDGH